MKLSSLFYICVVFHLCTESNISVSTDFQVKLRKHHFCSKKCRKKVLSLERYVLVSIKCDEGRLVQIAHFDRLLPVVLQISYFISFLWNIH